MPKCPPFRHYKQRKHVKSFFDEKFWDVTEQTTACERDDFVFGRHLILGEKLDLRVHRRTQVWGTRYHDPACVYVRECPILTL